MARKNAFYAQSGGVSAVINDSACGVLQTARQHSEKIGKVYAGLNGIIGAQTEDLIDTSVETEAAIAALKHTPGAVFGSCRYKLTSIHEHRAQYERARSKFFVRMTSASFSTASASQRPWTMTYPLLTVHRVTKDATLPALSPVDGFRQLEYPA
jgi:6-phosphofructokinase 1